MGTRWVAWCLNHEPPIQIELLHGASEIKDIELAATKLLSDELRESHPHCDLVLTGISGGVVAHACPGCGQHRDVRRLDLETLFLAYEAGRLGGAADAVPESYHRATAGWFRRNSCWTPSRLAKLFA